MSHPSNPFVESLRDSEAVRLLADAFPSYLSYVDRGYRYRFVNRAYESFFHLERELILDKHVQEVWGDEVFETLKPRLDRALGGETFTVESAFEGIYVVTTYVPHLLIGGHAVGTLIFVQDITELQASRAAAIQTERMASLGRLVSSLLHEIHSPLGVLVSNWDIVERSIDPLLPLLASDEVEKDPKAVLEPLRRRLEGMAQLRGSNEEALRRIRALLENLKTFAALDEAEIQLVDLHQGLESTLALIDHRLSPGITVAKAFGTIPRVEGHPGELNQVFMTLLLNAIDAIDPTGRVRIRTSTMEDRVQVEIADSGRGIAKEDLDRVFEPSFVIASGRVKAGFGLFVSRNIVRKHGGEMRVESELGVGSTFTVLLPASKRMKGFEV